MGIEPTPPAWKAGALPLSYTRSSQPAIPTRIQQTLLPGRQLFSATNSATQTPLTAGTHAPLQHHIHRVFNNHSPFAIANHGGSRIRTCEGRATRFTVWPLWPLGYPAATPRQQQPTKPVKLSRQNAPADCDSRDNRQIKTGDERRHFSQNVTQTRPRNSLNRLRQKS